MAKNSYWAERNALNAYKKADKFNSKLQKVYKSTYKKIDAQLKDLWLEMISEGEISKSSIYKNNRLHSIMEQVDKSLRELGCYTSDNMQLALLDVFEESYTQVIKDLSTNNKVEGSFTVLNKQIGKEIVNASYKNADYSTRVWENLSQIRSQIEQTIIETTSLGKDYKKASKALAERMSVSLSDAKRITVTETARVHSESTRQGAKDRGYKSFHILTEPDCCEECQEFEDKHYSIERDDLLPKHPHCKCCMVIDIDYEGEVE